MPTNLGTIGAYGTAGAQDKLKAMLAERVKAALVAQQQADKQTEFDIQRKQLASQEDDRRLAREDRQASAADSSAREVANNAQQAVSQGESGDDLTALGDTLKGNKYGVPLMASWKREGTTASLPTDGSIGATGPKGEIAPSGVSRGAGVRLLNPKQPPREPNPQEPMRVETLGDGTVPELKGKPVTAFVKQNPDGSVKRTGEMPRVPTAGQTTPTGALAGVQPHLVGPASAQAAKVGQAFADSQQAADDMSTFTKESRAGNKLGYAYLPTEGVLTLNTSRGVKRVNMAEIQAYGGAGSAWDRIMGFLGKQAAGESIPANVLDDIDALHAGVKANAATGYRNKLKVINQTYGSTFAPVEFDEAKPAAKSGGYDLVPQPDGTLKAVKRGG